MAKSPAKKKPTQQDRESAVVEIINGKRSQSAVAQDWDISRQAVSKWVSKYKEQGSLKPGKRGRPKLRPITDAEKKRFFYAYKDLLGDRGLKLGDFVPLRQRPTEAELRTLLSGVVTDQVCSEAMARRTAKELRLPIYSPPIPGLPEDFVFYREHVHLVDPYDENSPRPEDWEDPFDNVKKRRRTTFPKDPHEITDDKVPKDIEEYKAWVKETKQMLAEREAKKRKFGPAAPGQRTGKHSKNNKQQQGKKKKRRKKGKKR